MSPCRLAYWRPSALGYRRRLFQRQPPREVGCQRSHAERTHDRQLLGEAEAHQPAHLLDRACRQHGVNLAHDGLRVRAADGAGPAAAPSPPRAAPVCLPPPANRPTTGLCLCSTSSARTMRCGSVGVEHGHRGVSHRQDGVKLGCRYPQPPRHANACARPGSMAARGARPLSQAP